MNTRALCLLAALGAASSLTYGCGGSVGGTGGGGGSPGTTGSTSSTSGSTGSGVLSDCLDAMQGGTETDVDCGGICTRCADGKKCTIGADCTSNTCTGGVCAEPTCSDKAKDGKETDLDCGGTCPPCADGKSCAFATDCLSGVCTAGLCQASTCNDMALNGTETGVDCGGVCPKCTDGQPCTGGSDCASGICEGTTCKSNVGWATRVGDATDQTALGVAFDPVGNVIVVGAFHGTIDWGGGPLVSAGGTDIFVVKLDPTGKHIWSKRFGDASDQSATAVATSATGEVWITGAITGNVDFGGGLLSSADPLADTYLAAFSPSGTHNFSKRFGGLAAQRGTALALATNGDIYFGGTFDGTIDFGCGAPLASAGSGDVFIARFDNGVTCIYSKRFGDASAQELLSLSPDLANNVFLGGRFKGTVNFGGASLTMPPTTFGGFAAKLDATGAHVFSTSFGATTNAQEVTGVAADLSGNVFVAGSFSGTLTAGSTVLTSAGVGDLFVARLDPAGTAVWANRAGDATDQVGALHVVADAAGNVLVAGTLQGTIDLGGNPLTSVGGNDIFLAKLDSAGNHVWSLRLGDAASQQLNGVALNGTTAAFAGNFTGAPDFGGTVLTSVGGDDAFAATALTP
ncbi:MAG: hypothetical protein ABJE95_23760 [Byssovorax sp.]